MKPLTLDQLHEIISKLNREAIPRYSGKTTALLWLLIGELQLGDDNTVHLVVCPTDSWANRLQDTFCRILDIADVGIIYKRRGNQLITSREQRILFCGFDDLEYKTKGFRYRTVTLDVPDDFVGIPTNLDNYIHSIMEETTNDAYQQQPIATT